jgi:hypothetical protein
MEKGKPNIVLQFRIELMEIEPAIWRCIQVPSKYSFWDLHVAIQDSLVVTGFTKLPGKVTQESKKDRLIHRLQPVL